MAQTLQRAISRADSEATVFPALTPSWTFFAALVVAAFIVYGATGQIDAGQPLGLAAWVVAPGTFIGITLALAWAGDRIERLEATWAMGCIAIVLAISFCAAADTGEANRFSPLPLANVLVVMMASMAFNARFVWLLGALSVAGIFGADALGATAGYPTHYAGDLAGSLIVVAGTAFSMTRGQMEARLRTRIASSREAERLSSSRLEALAQYSPAALALFDASGESVYRSAAMERLVGPVSLGFVGGESARKALREALSGRVSRTELTVNYEDRERVLDGVFFPVDQGAGLIAVDVTEVRSLADQVSRAQRIQTVGTIAGGVAHDFNNLLTVILGNLSIIKMMVGDRTGETREVLDETELACERGAELVRTLLNYARPVPAGLEPLLVTRLLEETTRLAKGLIPADVTLKVEPPSPDVVVNASFGALQQVLLNLVVNARDAISGPGCVRLFVERETVRPNSDRAARGLTPGKYIAIAVEDTGSGMAPQTVAQIFEPFFTTKSEGRGTGLGLASARSIVETHGGTIDVYSVEGLGSIFRMVLPEGSGNSA